MDPTIPLLGIYPKDAPTYNKDTCSTVFIAALFIIARSWKEPRCPSTEEWIRKCDTFTLSYLKNDFTIFLGKRMNYPETTPPRDPSHNQPPNPDTIAQCQKDFAEGTLL